MRPGARRRLWLFALLAAPLAFTDDFSRGALVRVSAFALAATGVSLVSGITGQISLGHAALMGAGGFTSAGLAVHAGWPVPAAWLAGVILAAALGLVVGIPSLRLKGQYLALATLGAGVIVFQVARQASGLTGGDVGLGDVPAALSPAATAYLACGVLAAALFVTGNITASPAGRRFRAVRDSETGAAASGVWVAGSKVLAFVASAVMAGVAGALFAHSEGFVATGEFSPAQSFTLMLAAVLGGLRSPYGGALGVLAILGPSELAPRAFSWLEQYQVIAWGPVALLVVFRWPDGVAGGLGRLARRFRAAATPESFEIAPASGPAAPAARGATVIRAEGISKRFGGLVALGDVALDVRARTIHAIVGPNGSGKTTLLDCITGVMRPNAGTIAILGRDATGSSPHRVARLGVGRTFQSVALFPTMTALENVLVALDEASRPADALGIGRDSEARAAGLLAEVGLSGKGRTPAGALSYGERKRLELARALAARPAVLLLDEPAAGRSESEILELGRFLMRCRAAGTTVVLVEHHMNFVLAIADVVTVLDEGRVVAEGPPSAVRSDPAVAAAYLGESA
jgi:branched-chain amino acid transport system ATP-binding protein/branched-chain amino acid transport system permease protein